MGAKVRIEINQAGVREFLSTSNAALVAELERRALAIAQAAGEGVETKTFQGSDRARVHIATVTPEAMRAEAEERTLTRALEAGRG